MEKLKNAIDKKALVSRLNSEIMALQGYHQSAFGTKTAALGLGQLESSFVHGVFPGWGLQEFISNRPEQSAATSGFMAALAGKLMKADDICVWVSTKRTIFPLALSYFGLSPDHIIFIDLKKQKDLLWVIEEALSCKALSVVVGEVQDLTLIESRRLQLAIERSRITGLIHRVSPRLSNPISSECRWKITHLPTVDLLPGVGNPRWNAQIEKIRGGVPRGWQLEWNGEQFVYIDSVVETTSTQISNAS